MDPASLEEMDLSIARVKVRDRDKFHNQPGTPQETSPLPNNQNYVVDTTSQSVLMPAIPPQNSTVLSIAKAAIAPPTVHIYQNHEVVQDSAISPASAENNLVNEREIIHHLAKHLPTSPNRTPADSFATEYTTSQFSNLTPSPIPLAPLPLFSKSKDKLNNFGEETSSEAQPSTPLTPLPLFSKNRSRSRSTPPNRSTNEPNINLPSSQQTSYTAVTANTSSSLHAFAFASPSPNIHVRTPMSSPISPRTVRQSNRSSSIHSKPLTSPDIQTGDEYLGTQLASSPPARLEDELLLFTSRIKLDSEDPFLGQTCLGQIEGAFLRDVNVRAGGGMIGRHELMQGQIERGQEGTYDQEILNIPITTTGISHNTVITPLDITSASNPNSKEVSPIPSSSTFPSHPIKHELEASQIRSPTLTLPSPSSSVPTFSVLSEVVTTLLSPPDNIDSNSNQPLISSISATTENQIHPNKFNSSINTAISFKGLQPSFQSIPLSATSSSTLDPDLDPTSHFPPHGPPYADDIPFISSPNPPEINTQQVKSIFEPRLPYSSPSSTQTVNSSSKPVAYLDVRKESPAIGEFELPAKEVGTEGGYRFEDVKGNEREGSEVTKTEKENEELLHVVAKQNVGKWIVEKGKKGKNADEGQIDSGIEEYERSREVKDADTAEGSSEESEDENTHLRHGSGGNRDGDNQDSYDDTREGFSGRGSSDGGSSGSSGSGSGSSGSRGRGDGEDEEDSDSNDEGNSKESEDKEKKIHIKRFKFPPEITSYIENCIRNPDKKNDPCIRKGKAALDAYKSLLSQCQAEIMHLTNMVDSQGDALRIYNKLMEMDHKSKTATAQQVTPLATATDQGHGNNNNDDDDLSELTIEELKTRIGKLSEQLDELRARSKAECKDRIERAVREKQKEVEAEWKEKLRREKSRVDDELDTLMKKEDCEKEKRRLQEQVETLRAIYESGTSTNSTKETNNETKGGAVKERESKEAKETSDKSITELNAMLMKTQKELQKMTTARNNYMDRLTATEEALENEKERLNKVIRNRDERLEALEGIKDENNKLQIAVETILNDNQGGSEFDTDRLLLDRSDPTGPIIFALTRMEMAMFDMVVNRAHVGKQPDDTGAALSAAQDVIDLAQATADNDWIGRAYFHMAVATFYQDNEDQAQYYMNLALPYIDSIMDSRIRGAMQRWNDSSYIASPVDISPQGYRKHFRIDPSWSKRRRSSASSGKLSPTTPRDSRSKSKGKEKREIYDYSTAHTGSPDLARQRHHRRRI